MPNFYKILGVSADATLKEIKKAFRKKAIDCHPDKQGGNTEAMSLLNQAHKILTDPDRRQAFDTEQELFEEDDDLTPSNLPQLTTSAESFSADFKRQHASYLAKFSQQPLTAGLINSYFTPLSTEAVYGNQQHLTIFSYLFTKAILQDTIPDPFEIPEEPLTPALACSLLQQFLTGRYFGASLDKLVSYFASQTKTLAKPEQGFYSAIYSILVMAQQYEPTTFALLAALRQITAYAKSLSELPDYLILLFQDRYYRHLLQSTLNAYWQNTIFELSPDILAKFDGQEPLKNLLEQLKNTLTNLNEGKERQSVLAFARCVKLLLKLEKFIQTEQQAIFRTSHSTTTTISPIDQINSKQLMQPKTFQKAAAYRVLGYRVLDWLPVFSGMVNSGVLTNILLQAGLCFQLASRCISSPAEQMADEKLAEKVYCLAYSIAQRNTPDVELYCCLQILNFFSRFSYQDPTLHDIIKALQLRTRTLTDIFPFYEATQLSIAFIKDEGGLLNVMRSLLQNLVAWIKMNDTEIFAIELEHSDASILYQAYEGCIKRWYQKPYQAETENELRIMLMATLLADKQWQFADVDQNMSFSGTALQRTEDKWLKPTPILTETPDLAFYDLISVDGIVIEHKSGELTLNATRAESNTPDCFKILSQQDIYEVFSRNIQAAIFSLDPIDPAMPYHPFNTMRYEPSSLYGTRFLQTLLAADYILKLLTVDQEVQGAYPYQTRPLDQLTSHLPEYLKKVIFDYQQSQRSEATHRFWFEAETVDVAFDADKLPTDETQKIMLGDVKMVVRKHKMVRDKEGNLVDAPEEHEGWHFYILKDWQKAAFNNGASLSMFQQPAMLLIPYSNTLLFWENDERSYFNLQNYNDQLIALFESCKADNNGKIIEDTEMTERLYRLSKEVTRQTGKFHHYSPEYILAQELTRYYDEFALYYPVFKRLKAFTQLTVLTRVLNNVKENNEKSREKLAAILDQIKSWRQFINVGGTMPQYKDDNCQTVYEKIQTEADKTVRTRFNEWRRELSYAQIKSARQEKTLKLKQEIGTLTFSDYSTEVSQACEQMVEATLRGYAGHVSYELTRQLKSQVDNMRSTIAAQLSKTKRDNIKNQLQEAFASILRFRLGQRQYDSHIESLLDGNIQPLVKALADYDYEQAIQQLSKALLNAPITQVEYALEGQTTALAQLVKHVRDAQYKSFLSSQEQELQPRLNASRRLADNIQQLGLFQKSPNVDLEKKCLWVPASLRHNKSEVGNNRHTFFCYGGVSLQANIRQVNQVWTSPQSRALPPGGGRGGSGGGTGGSGSGSGGSGGGGYNNRKAMLNQAGFQDHHIISPTNRHTKNHELFQLAGLDPNARANRIFLPTRPDLHPTRSIHQGRHVSSYSQTLAEDMKVIVEAGKMAGWNQQQYAAGLRGLIAEYRQDLRSGDIGLNCNKRPWAT